MFGNEKITPVIIGSSGWLSTAAQHFFWTPNEEFLSPIVVGSTKRVCKKFGNQILPIEGAINYIREARIPNINFFRIHYKN